MPQSGPERVVRWQSLTRANGVPMKRLLLTSAALIACAAAGSAGAADLSVAPPPAAPGWSWTGCYVGGNVGGTRAQNSAALSPGGLYLNASSATPPPNAAGGGDFPANVAALSNSYTVTNSGWEAGGQIGCNGQWGAAVLGLEGDWQWTNTATSADALYAAFPDLGNPHFTTASHTEHVDVTQRWFATARVRAGFTPMERVLLYGTGGLAWANYESNTAVAFGAVPFVGVYNGATHVGSASSNQLGWVAGGGVEWAVTNNWSVKAEYLYLRFDAFSYASPLVASFIPAAPGYAWNTNVTPREQIVRIGVNYKFDWGPVVARY
jgi:outer membrane immunogenic protein